MAIEVYVQARQLGKHLKAAEGVVLLLGYSLSMGGGVETRYRSLVETEQLGDSSMGRLPCQPEGLLPESSAAISGDPGVVGI
jgi:hypothetical protein